MKQRLRIALIALAIGFAIALALQLEGYVVSLGTTLMLHAPALAVALFAIWNRRTTLGAASLLALGIVLCLRPFTLLLLRWLAFQNRMDLWTPVVLSLPAIAVFFIRPIARVRPATIVAGVVEAWWFVHTFTDFLYYTGEIVQMTLAIGSAMFLVAAIAPPTFRWRVAWSTIEPACVALVGWLTSLPFYKIHTQNMRIPDLTMQLFSVALPTAILGLVWGLTAERRVRETG